MTDIVQLLQHHRSIRKFTDQPVAQDRLEAYIQAGQAAATSSFIQATTVIQISAGATRDQLAEWAGGQAYVSTSPVFLVFCADMRRHQLACDLHQAEMLSGYTEQFMTATIDVALFAQNVVACAEADGLGICYIGGLRNNPDKVSSALELPELVYPVFGLCLGYPDQNPEVKPRLPLSVVLKQDRYDDSADADLIRDYDTGVRRYYETRTGGNKSMTWSEQISGMLKKEARPHMLPFLQQRGFLKR
ncbi:oxygen-insensitive NADPH nitroreductase [Natronospirillum operosum]|uniref:Oxygen-insensitive NADPH nitroreductase n=1 Tax=Natronospirillum operosum TaxID=2759953 RepID=A0A4Z0W8G0_9GAMM|nr:oxygen-insensitive NADPH nitroreductase [Natronospirillum operosum]TGG90251.1 oxygen-insensitive NADPH nitroreductase [Natronospirillum operosum]